MSAEPAADPILHRAELAVRQWRAAHLRATFAEIEAALDQELRAARAALLTAVLPEVPADSAPICPDCGGVLLWRGAQERTVRTDGDHPVVLRRADAHCPH